MAGKKKRVKAMGGGKMGKGKMGKRVKAMKGKRVKARGGNKIKKLADGGRATSNDDVKTSKAMESGAPYPSTKRAGSISVEQHQNAVKQWKKQNPEAAIALGAKQIKNAIDFSRKNDFSLSKFKSRLNMLFPKPTSTRQIKGKPKRK